MAIARSFLPGLVGPECKVGMGPEVGIVRVEPEVGIRLDVKGGIVAWVELITMSGLGWKKLILASEGIFPEVRSYT